jgi:hypothetical protein
VHTEYRPVLLNEKMSRGTLNRNEINRKGFSRNRVDKRSSGCGPMVTFF